MAFSPPHPSLTRTHLSKTHVAYIGHASLPVTPPILRRKQHPVSVSTYIYLTRIRSHQSSIAVFFPPPTWRPTRP